MHGQAREVVIQHILGIREEHFPFHYLGVSIFKGRPKPDYFHQIMDKVCYKLSSWKGHQLSQAACLQLIDTVITHY